MVFDENYMKNFRATIKTKNNHEIYWLYNLIKNKNFKTPELKKEFAKITFEKLLSNINPHHVIEATTSFHRQRAGFRNQIDEIDQIFKKMSSILQETHPEEYKNIEKIKNKLVLFENYHNDTLLPKMETIKKLYSVKNHDLDSWMNELSNSLESRLKRKKSSAVGKFIIDGLDMNKISIEEQLKIINEYKNIENWRIREAFSTMDNISDEVLQRMLFLAEITKNTDYIDVIPTKNSNAKITRTLAKFLLKQQSSGDNTYIISSTARKLQQFEPNDPETITLIMKFIKKGISAGDIRNSVNVIYALQETPITPALTDFLVELVEKCSPLEICTNSMELIEYLEVKDPRLAKILSQKFHVPKEIHKADRVFEYREIQKLAAKIMIKQNIDDPETMKIILRETALATDAGDIFRQKSKFTKMIDNNPKLVNHALKMLDEGDYGSDTKYHARRFLEHIHDIHPNHKHMPAISKIISKKKNSFTENLAVKKARQGMNDIPRGRCMKAILFKLVLPAAVIGGTPFLIQSDTKIVPTPAP